MIPRKKSGAQQLYFIRINTLQILTTYLITTGGADYGSNLTSEIPIVFFAGVSHALFDIPIIYDNIKEDNETFYVTINACGITLGSINKITVTILDDESKYNFLLCTYIIMYIPNYVLIRLHL